MSKTYDMRHLHPYECILYLFMREADFHKHLKRNGIPDRAIKPEADASTVVYSRPGAKTYIFVVMKSDAWKHKPSTSELAGLCFHEAVHVWQECCAQIGETSPGDEIAAYSIQEIGQWLLHNALYDLGEIPA